MQVPAVQYTPVTSLAGAYAPFIHHPQYLPGPQPFQLYPAGMEYNTQLYSQHVDPYGTVLHPYGSVTQPTYQQVVPYQHMYAPAYPPDMYNYTTPTMTHQTQQQQQYPVDVNIARVHQLNRSASEPVPTLESPLNGGSGSGVSAITTATTSSLTLTKDKVVTMSGKGVNDGDKARLVNDVEDYLNEEVNEWYTLRYDSVTSHEAHLSAVKGNHDATRFIAKKVTKAKK
eukprot:jgi/Chlat1/5504/Chrsp360S05323